VHDALEAEGIPYLLAGSFATMAYSIPRSTKDVDFVIEMQQPGFDTLVRRLNSRFELDPQQYLETSTWSRRFILKARETPFEVELFLKTTDPHHESQWSRKRRMHNPILGRDVWMPTPEDVVIQKIRWGRPRDRADVIDVFTVQGDSLDWPYIERWCDTQGTRALLDELRTAVPPI
jgi:hypothetical protein